MRDCTLELSSLTVIYWLGSMCPYLPICARVASAGLIGIGTLNRAFWSWE
jgi:hypothetical protein